MSEVENTQVNEEINTEAVEVKEAVVDAPIAPITASTNFLDTLSEDLRSDASLKDFKDVDSLAKSYVSSQKMLGTSIRIPSTDASEEARADFYTKLKAVPGVVKLPDSDNPESINNFYNKLGRPESPEQYDFKSNDADIQDIISGAPDLMDEFSKVAHGLGLNRSQGQALIDYEAKKVLMHNQVQLDQKEQTLLTLRDTWGPEYKNKLARAKAVASVYSEKYPDDIAQLDALVGNNAAFISMLSELGESLNEKGHEGLQMTKAYGMDAEEARAQIKEIKVNFSHAYYNEQDPEHEAAVKKMHKLADIAYTE